jgi:hypothetical protein
MEPVPNRDLALEKRRRGSQIESPPTDGELHGVGLGAEGVLQNLGQGGEGGRNGGGLAVVDHAGLLVNETFTEEDGKRRVDRSLPLRQRRSEEARRYQISNPWDFPSGYLPGYHPRIPISLGEFYEKEPEEAFSQQRNPQ